MPIFPAGPRGIGNPAITVTQVQGTIPRRIHAGIIVPKLPPVFLLLAFCLAISSARPRIWFRQ